MIYRGMTAEQPWIHGHLDAHTDIRDAVLAGIDAMPTVDFTVTGRSWISKCDWTVARDHDRPYRQHLDPALGVYFDQLIAHAGYQLLMVHNLWFQQYTTGSEHNWHVHRDCQFTSVYYLELPDSAPRTEYKDPYTGLIGDIQVQEGDIITFPSFMIHRAPKNTDLQRKTIISWNSDFDIGERSIY